MVEIEVTLILPTWLNLKDKDSKSEISVRFRTMIQADSLYLLQLKFMADDPNVEQELAFQEFKTKSTNIVRISKPIASAVTFNSATIVWDAESGSVDGYKEGEHV